MLPRARVERRVLRPPHRQQRGADAQVVRGIEQPLARPDPRAGTAGRAPRANIDGLICSRPSPRRWSGRAAAALAVDRARPSGTGRRRSAVADLAHARARARAAPASGATSPHSRITAASKRAASSGPAGAAGSAGQPVGSLQLVNAALRGTNHGALPHSGPHRHRGRATTGSATGRVAGATAGETADAGLRSAERTTNARADSILTEAGHRRMLPGSIAKVGAAKPLPAPPTKVASARQEDDDWGTGPTGAPCRGCPWTRRLRSRTPTAAVSRPNTIE